MFNNDTIDESKIIVNSAQYSPNRLGIYSINKCEDQVIGFEFITKRNQSSPQCCGSVIVNLCVPIEISSPVQLDSVRFIATDDPCYLDWIVNKTIEPEVELQKNEDDETTGILVRFNRNETCGYPLNMAYKLYGSSAIECEYLISSGLLIFR